MSKAGKIFKDITGISKLPDTASGIWNLVKKMHNRMLPEYSRNYGFQYKRYDTDVDKHIRMDEKR